jgi:myo-inositol-1(or 4)-monophosphatase
MMKDALIGVGFPFRRNDDVETYTATFAQLAKNCAGLRRAGAASLDLAYVAAGRLDAFWEPNLQSWDIAAGSLLVLEAGGLVTDFDGEGNYLQTGEIVAGTPKVFGQLLPVVRRNYKPAA